MVHKAILLLKKIPKGKVTTYKELANACNSSPRAIGQIMKRNRHPEIYPCYKVVKSDGYIGGYAGCTKGRKILEKTEKLREDGINIINGRIDLKKHMHKF